MSKTPPSPQPEVNSATTDNRPGVTLLLATVGFLVNFWAWSLLGPLGAVYGDELNLSPFQVSMAVALPVVVGSLGRIPVGAMTDRYGARVMFPAVSLLTVIPTIVVGIAATNYVILLIGGFFLGIGGTAFAVGVPLVNASYAPSRRGTAIGIFGIGMSGTAVAAFTTVPLTEAFGRPTPFYLASVVLVIYAIVSWLLIPEVPTTKPSEGTALSRFWRTLRRPATLQLSLVYAMGFGGFVAFSVYLPTYLVAAYDLTRQDASLRTAGFVVLAVAARPLGGWLSDRWAPVPVLALSFLITAICGAMAATHLDLLPEGTVAFLVMGIMLGASSGACFALVARVAPPGEVGAITGVVGAAGGLGGFFPPLVMGAVYGATGEYTWGLALLAITALLIAWFVVGPVRKLERAAQR